MVDVLRFGIVAKEPDGEVDGGLQLVGAAIVAIDEHEEMGCVEPHHGAGAVAGGGGEGACFIAIDGKAIDVERAAADGFVGFGGATEGELNVGAYDLVGIEGCGAVVGEEGNEIDEVDDGVDCIEVLALHDAADELFAGGTVAAGVFACCLIGGAGGFDAGEELDAVGGEARAGFADGFVDFLPEEGMGRGVAYVGAYGCSFEVGADGAEFRTDGDGVFHFSEDEDGDGFCLGVTFRRGTRRRSCGNGWLRG